MQIPVEKKRWLEAIVGVEMAAIVLKEAEDRTTALERAGIRHKEAPHVIPREATDFKERGIAVTDIDRSSTVAAKEGLRETRGVLDYVQDLLRAATQGQKRETADEPQQQPEVTPIADSPVAGHIADLGITGTVAPKQPTAAEVMDGLKAAEEAGNPAAGYAHDLLSGGAVQ